MGEERNMKVRDVFARLLRTKASAARGARKPGHPRDRQAPAALDFSQQLEVARDPELMREALQEHLRPLGGKNYRVRECRITRVRQHDERFMLLYTLQLEEPGTGRELTQLVSGVMHVKGRRNRRKWEELRGSEPERGTREASAAAFEPYAYVPELEMLVQVFPHDHWLPTLPALMEGPPPELEPLLLARFGPGEWRAETWDVEPVRYLPGKRITLRLTARAREGASGRTEERRFYIKVYRKEEAGELPYRVLQALWDRAEEEGEGFSVGRPIAYLDDLRALVQEEIPGIPLRDILLLGGDGAIPAVRRAARALAGLHLTDVVPPQRSRTWKEVFDGKVKKTEESLRRTYPHLGPEVEEISGAVIAGLEGAPTAPTHCDLGLDHILLDGDRPALVDLDAFAEADPVLDVASILGLLATMPFNSSLSQDRAREAARAFAEEYFAHVPETWRERLPLHYAGALLKRIAGLSKNPRLGQQLDKIEALLQEARDSAAGRVRL